jgi:D-alanyl-D-alanine dipeptidase
LRTRPFTFAALCVLTFTPACIGASPHALTPTANTVGRSPDREPAGRTGATAAPQASTPGAAADAHPDRTGATAAPQASTPGAAADAHAGFPIPDDITRLVVVRTAAWDVVRGSLTLYRRSPGGTWTLETPAFEVVVGRTGLGWGRGLHGDDAPPGRPGPVKREGDGRAPAGVFRIGAAAYGYDGAAPEGTRLEYHPVNDRWVCVDDPASRSYNTVLDAATVSRDWNSAESMRLPNDLYARVMVVEHNVPPVPGHGSCIFLHVWRGPSMPTVGCTAMPIDRLEALMRALIPGSSVLVQLPGSEYEALRGAWKLP